MSRRTQLPRIQEDTRPAATDDGSGSTSPPTSCVTEDTRPLASGFTTHILNPFAPSFDRPRREAVQTETEPNEDELPAHINLLYETTIAQTRLTDDVDRQFGDVLRIRASTFAKDSTDLGFCSVLQHDADTPFTKNLEISTSFSLLEQLWYMLLREFVILLQMDGTSSC